MRQTGEVSTYNMSRHPGWVRDIVMVSSVWESMDVKIDPAVAGLTAGVIHHCAVQYPKQAGLFSTLYAFAVTNVIFIILLLGPRNTLKFHQLGQIIRNVLTFDTIYVSHWFLVILMVQVSFCISMEDSIQCLFPTSWDTYQVLVCCVRLDVLERSSIRETIHHYGKTPSGTRYIHWKKRTFW